MPNRPISSCINLTWTLLSKAFINLDLFFRQNLFPKLVVAQENARFRIENIYWKFWHLFLDARWWEINLGLSFKMEFGKGQLVIQYLMWGFRLVSSICRNVISRGLPIFGSFCKLLRNVITEIFAKPSANWEVSSSWILTGTISRPSCSFMCAKLVIQYLMWSFRLVSPTRQNVTSRGLPIFGNFCKLLRNVVTETFANLLKIWEVSSNRILTGGPSCSFINVKSVIHYLMYGFRPVSSTC